MSQKPNFQKSAIHKPAPRKQGIFLTVRANWFFEQTSNEKGQPPLCDHIKSRMIVKSYHLCPRSSGGVKVPGWHRGRTVRGAMRSSRVRECAHRPPEAGEGVAVWHKPCTLYIYIDKTNYFNAKTKNYLFLFGHIKISLYICTRKQERINNSNEKIQDYEKAN